MTPQPPHLICYNQIIAEDALVGIDMAIVNNLELLSEQKCTVLAITGPAGSGKTALAKILYRRKNELQHNITGAAWVTLSREPNIKMVLKDILRQILKCPLIEIENNDVNELIKTLKDQLSRQSRYFNSLKQQITIDISMLSQVHNLHFLIVVHNLQ
jgi:ABC-type dipeptide/oligopeptide/nickel transport system ATPase subunit